MQGMTRILAIETSGRCGSAALLQAPGEHVELVRYWAESGSERTAQSLAPSIERLLSDAGWKPNSVNLVAVTLGPGSFTGLRIGVTTAKAYAYAAGADVLGVNTLKAIASQSPPSSAPLWAVSEAQRQELFAAQYAVDDGGPYRTVRETCILSQEEWISGLRAGDRVTGPALVRLKLRLPAGLEIVAADLWQPTAAAVGELAWRAYRAGQRDDVWSLVPKYYRVSAAEEKNPS